MHIQDVEDAMEKEIKNMLYTVDTEAFIEKITPRNPTATQALRDLKKAKHYQASRWAGFPERPPSGEEKVLYKPFASVSNAIVKTIRHEVRTKIVYLDCHSETPKSTEPDMAAGRPYGAGAAADSAMKALEVKIRKLEEEIAADTQHAVKKQNALSKLRRKEKDL
ncbi:hypothetical protein C0995_005390, partial [Termitomyces sp. Mi166